MRNFESSSDEETGILKKALDVELPKNFNPKKTPTTGEEYLHYVMYERKKCRKWITVDIDRNKFNNKETVKVYLSNPIKEAPSHLLPSQRWQENQVTDFLKLRNFVLRKNKSEPEGDLVHESHWRHLILEGKPTFSQLTGLKQCAKMQLLNLINDYLKTINVIGELNDNVGIWIYSTLASLDLPLSPDNCHELRELAKEMAALRAQLNSDKEYKFLNLCICLIANVFGQTDLADV